MGYEFLLVVPMIIMVGLCIVKNVVGYTKKVVLTVLMCIIIFVYIFLYPGLIRVRIYKTQPYVTFEWDWGRRFEKSRIAFHRYIKKQMEKNGIEVYEDE